MTNQPVAIITGSSRGIGRAIAVRLASDGFAVVVNYMSSRNAADEVVREIKQSGETALSVGADIGQEEDRRLLIDNTLKEYGRLDVLVNNAGITSQGRKDLLESTEDSWDLVFNTNLKGPFFLAKLAAKEMIKGLACGDVDNAQIINISSISSYAVSTNRADYCIAKAGMQMMTWLLAERLAEENIMVFEICPGVIASDMTEPVKEKYDKLIAEGLSPIRRWGKGEDVAQAVSSLVSGAFPFTTGQRINVDGGFHIRRL